MKAVHTSTKEVNQELLRLDCQKKQICITEDEMSEHEFS